MVSKLQRKRNHSIFEAIAKQRKNRGKKQNKLKGQLVKSLKGKSELRL